MGRLPGKSAVITGAAMVVDGGLTAGRRMMEQPPGWPEPTGFAGPSFEPVPGAS